MGLKEIVINLDNQHNTYYPGQTLYGTTEITVDSPKKIRGICVKVKGEGHTEWCESKEEQTSDGKTESTNIMHTGHEEYFQSTFYIVGNNSGNNEIELPAGKHAYNFTCALPPVLPSSFEGPFGYVRYTLKIILDRPWKFDQEKKLVFTVINAFDLNLNPSYKQPIHIQMEKTFCCLCCASAPVTVDIRSPVSGYVPGQVIPIRVDLENKSNVQVHRVKIYLRRLTTYRAISPADAIKKTEDMVVSTQEGPAPAGTTKTWDLTLQLPPTPPSDLVNCNIIDLDHDIYVECDVSGFHTNFSANKYIVIGTVPLLGLPGQPDPGQHPTGTPSAPPSDSNVGSIEPPYQRLYPSLSEPVYQKSQYESRSLKERGICIQIKGVGHTEWSKSGKPVTTLDASSKIYIGHEEYFRSNIYVAGSSSGHGQIELTPGKHVYKFDCPLPPVLPSSFEGPFGYVRYTVKVTLERPWKFDHEKKMAFTIVNILDLNRNPLYKEPIQIQMEKKFSCLCCTSAPVSVDIRSPISGYAPGQFVPIRIYVENPSDTTIDLVKIYLKRLTIYRATSSPDAVKKTEDVIFTVEDGPLHGKTLRVDDQYRQLPPTPPSNLAYCNIINLTYHIYVECQVSGCHTNFSAKQCMTVGTVPILGMPAQTIPPGLDPRVVPTDPEGIPIVYPPYQILYETLTDPVYERCRYKSRDLKERDESEYVMIQGPENFAPYCPTYAAIEAPPFL